MPGDPDEFEDRPEVLDDEVIRCWCGAEGTYDQLFDDDTLGETCGGLGQLQCFCGGDLCVCHHHGETECPGCEDCEPDGGGDYDDGGEG
jgi:hypothetical protein